MGTVNIQTAVQEFKSKRELEKLEVPEWGGDLYYYPTVSVKEKKEILKFSQADGSWDLEGLVYGLIERARDQDGKRIFKKVDRLELLTSVDAHILERVFLEMRLDTPSLEDAEKN